MYARMYACMYACMHVCVVGLCRACIYIYIHIHVYIRTYIHTYLLTYIHMYIHVNINKETKTCIYIRIYTYTHTIGVCLVHTPYTEDLNRTPKLGPFLLRNQPRPTSARSASAMLFSLCVSLRSSGTPHSMSWYNFSTEPAGIRMEGAHTFGTWGA